MGSRRGRNENEAQGACSGQASAAREQCWTLKSKQCKKRQTKNSLIHKEK
jgi:hypothetical protein